MNFKLNAEFPVIDRLPTYVFNVINQLKMEAIERGEDIIDFGMGNPDQSTPKHIVEEMRNASNAEDMHRYSMSQGSLILRRAICNWYKRFYDVDLDAETETIVTIGSKEGLAHLAIAISGKGDTVFVAEPSYPIHRYGFVIAGADVLGIPIIENIDFIETLENSICNAWQKPKALLINFPSNPTTQCVDLDFFIQIIKLAKKYNFWVIHDFAYANIVFDGYEAPSILQVSGAKDVAVEFFSLSKSYNMPGWRVGFMVGNPILVNALSKIKSYLDYGLFMPVQAAAIVALEDDQQCVKDICNLYQQRRDILCSGLNAAGWNVEKPKGTMFVWARIPEQFLSMGSLGFAKKLLNDAKIAVSPGVGFGEYGDKYVRFALIADDEKMKVALRNIQAMLLKLPTAMEADLQHLGNSV